MHLSPPVAWPCARPCKKNGEISAELAVLDLYCPAIPKRHGDAQEAQVRVLKAAAQRVGARKGLHVLPWMRATSAFSAAAAASWSLVRYFRLPTTASRSWSSHWSNVTGGSTVPAASATACRCAARLARLPTCLHATAHDPALNLDKRQHNPSARSTRSTRAVVDGGGGAPCRLLQRRLRRRSA